MKEITEGFKVGDIVDWLGVKGKVVEIEEGEEYPVCVEVRSGPTHHLVASAHFTRDGKYLDSQTQRSITLVSRVVETPTKPEKNEFRIGDKVFIRRMRVQWEMDHMEEMQSIGMDEKTFKDCDMQTIAAWAMAAQGRRLTGEVTAYGSADDSGTGRHDVRVRVSNAFGTIDSYFSEDDLMKVSGK